MGERRRQGASAPVRARDPDLRMVAGAGGQRSRALAAAALLRAERDGAFPGIVLDALSQKFGWTERADLAFALDLAQGTLRWRGCLDPRIDCHLDKSPAQVDPYVRQVLRVAAYELIGPAPAAAHAAVHAAVETVKRLRGRALGGFVNAVLRKIAAEAASGRAVGLDEAAATALPAWLRGRLEAAWGPADAASIALWSLANPGRTVRVNRARGTAEEVVAAFPGAQVSPWTPWCVRLPPGAGDLRFHPLVVAGKMTAQEEGAYLATEPLPLGARARVLDACAGRGTKTAALIERAPDDVRFVAADVMGRKLRAIPPEFARLHLREPATVEVDWTEAATEPSGGPFDLILVDAPCTGAGTLSRRPEIRWRLRERGVALLASLQDMILERVSGLLASGGVLVYVVCSLLGEEGEARVARLRCVRPDLVPVRLFPSPPWRSCGAGSALLPHESGTDGFYAAALVRTAS